MKIKESSKGQVLLYKNKVEVRLDKETVWLPQKLIAELFDTERSVITKHIHNIFKTKELDGKSNVQKMHIPNSDKAAHLLYFVTKNHSFVDGNKRIAAALFICFLQKNDILLHRDGARRIDDNALVALTLMIASSKPSENDMMVKVILNLLGSKE